MSNAHDSTRSSERYHELDSYLFSLVKRGDTGVADQEWQLLFTSDASHNSDSLCSGIFDENSDLCKRSRPRQGLNMDHFDPKKCCRGPRLNQVSTHPDESASTRGSIRRLNIWKVQII